MKTFDINGSTVELLAAGHNAKKPMLLVSTASDLLPGEPQRKEWITYDEGGAKVRHAHETPQPHVHAQYRRYFHIVDDHNQLRQGTTTMADVWDTKQWWHRHFAESLGFWEVNGARLLTATPGVSPPACARAADGRPAARDRRGQRACGVTDGDDRRGPPVVQLCQAGFR